MLTAKDIVQAQANTGLSNLKMKKLASVLNNVSNQRLVEPNVPGNFIKIGQELSKDFLITTISNVSGQKVVVYCRDFLEKKRINF